MRRFASRTSSRASSPPSAATRTRPRASTPPPRPRSRSSRPTRRSGRSARPGSTITAIGVRGGAGPRVRGADRDRPADEAAARHPRPRLERAGGRARRRRLLRDAWPRGGGHRGDPPLLLGDAGAGRGGRRARLARLVRRQRHLPEVGRRLRWRRRWSPSTCCLSRPTAPTWRRRSFEASRTGRPTSPTPPRSSPRRAGSVRAARRDRLRERGEAVRLVRLGQNFLADPNLLEAIVADAALDPGDVVLEVGEGEGVLTERPRRARDACT